MNGTLQMRGGPTPHLDRPTISSTTRAVALLLHGGREVGTTPVHPWNTTVLRMRPFAGTISRRAPDVAVARLRYRYRGWNGGDADPIDDVVWALDTVRVIAGDLPVVLVGHSMGGRAALAVAGDASVTGVVALAPWLPRDEPVAQLTGREVVLLHGNRDRTTSPTGTAVYAERAAATAGAVVSLRLARTGHTMLTRARVWHELTARYVAAITADEAIAAVVVATDGVHSTRSAAA